MTDFFENLILRSAGDPTPLSVLQPRLPALFEPMGGVTEVPKPSPDPAVRETLVPMSGIQLTLPSTAGSPDRHPAHSDEPVMRERTMGSAADRNLLPIEQSVHLPAVERRQEVIQPPPSAATLKTEQPLQVLFKHVEPQRTILPRPQGRAVHKEPPGSEDHHSAPRKVPLKIIPAEPLPKVTQEIYKSPLPLPQKQVAHQEVIKPEIEKPNEGVPLRSSAETVSTKAESKPAAVLRPYPVASRRMQRIQPEPAELPAEHVVEIHIGRIEVRATPPPAPAKRPAQKPGITSLEEYLHSRPGDKS